MITPKRNLTEHVIKSNIRRAFYVEVDEPVVVARDFLKPILGSNNFLREFLESLITLEQLIDFAGEFFVSKISKRKVRVRHGAIPPNSAIVFLANSSAVSKAIKVKAIPFALFNLEAVARHFPLQ